MATPAPRGSRLSQAIRRLSQNKLYYNAFVLLLAVLGLLLMVLPAKLLTWEPEDKPELSLDVTFGSLSVQGYLSLLFILLGFVLMVFDIVG